MKLKDQSENGLFSCIFDKRRMIFPKLLLLVLCYVLPTYSASPYDCSFSNYCHPYGSDWWIRHATFCFVGCSSGKKYHCARDYDSPEVFKEGCAVEKNCSAGEEPYLSFKESGRAVTEPVVWCKICHDDNYYNPSTKPSSEYSECPDKKWNDCSPEKHKIFCKPDDSTSERYCRCDARKGYSPINDFSYQKCSYKDYDCKDYNKCDPQQRLLNYTCAPSCEEGFDRLSQDSDDCLPVPIIKTTKKPTIVNTTRSKNNITAFTTPPTRAPSSPEGTLACNEECDEYHVCDNGKCVCRNVCLHDVYDPVCGYDAKSNRYRTFPSDCDLKRSYCKQKQFSFHAAGECETVSGKTNTNKVAVAIGVSVTVGIVLLIVPIVIACCIKKYRFWPCSEYFPENTEIPMSKPERTETPPDRVDNTVVDGKTPNGKHVERQLSAPISEHEDVSTPNLTSNARKSPPPQPQPQPPPAPVNVYKTTHIYKGPVIQSKGGYTQIAVGGDSPGSKNKNVKVHYNKYDVKEGEAEPLVGGSDSDEEVGEGDPHKQSIPVEVHTEENQIPSETQPSETRPSENLKAEGGFGDSSATVDNDPPKATLTSKVVNVEADSVGKLFTQIIPGKDSVKKTEVIGLKRTLSMSQSHDSLLPPPVITNIKDHFKDIEEYKKLINTVMDLCLRYMIENMDPDTLLTVFPEKGIFDHTLRRDISDMVTQTDRSKKILNKIRETGSQYYHDFKVCLLDTKQFDCLRKIEKVQREVFARLTKDHDDSVSRRSRHSSGRIGSWPDLSGSSSTCISDSQSLKSEHSETIKEKMSANLENSSTESQGAEINQQGNNLFCPPDGMEPVKQGNRKPTYVPPTEETMEEKAYKCLCDLKSVLNVDRSWKEMPCEMFKIFQARCAKIREQLPELTSKSLLPEKLPNSLHYPENYQNIPQGFQAYRSSGKDKSCLYQSISLLLNGSENLQYSLRLLATLHAVESFKAYKKQLLETDLERLLLFFGSHLADVTYKKIKDMDDTESVTDTCLQVLIMETACLGEDSSELHVGFLSGALGMKIYQHFQDGRIGSELVPWEKIIQGICVNLDLPCLHIFWVNYSKDKNGTMDHIVPLLQNNDVTT